MIAFREPRRSDALYIAKRMAPMDALECAVYGRSPRQALESGMVASLRAWTITVDGKPLAMAGVTPINMMDGRGTPWLLLTPEARRYAKAFLERARPIVAEMQALFPSLENRVHRDNLPAIRWLRRLGFTIEAEPVYIGGEPMLRFWRSEYVHGNRDAGPVQPAVGGGTV